MAAVNYNHLHYFWTVAREGGLAKAAQRLNVSQSSISVQLKKLEDQLGHALFERHGRGLQLTEEGRIAFDYADRLFETGAELVDRLNGRRQATRHTLRVGAIATLSRNFQLALLKRLIDRHDVHLVVRTGVKAELLEQLASHALDLVLTNRPVRRDSGTPWHSTLLDQQEVSLVAPPAADGGARLRYPADLADTPVVLPSLDSEVRQAFDRQMETAGIRPIVLAELDDMALLRLFARESGCLTLVPPVVVRDELASGRLVEHHRIPDITESFYAVTLGRRFPNPLVADLLAGGKVV
jgi:LysR family transcriptional activator of nhaA